MKPEINILRTPYEIWETREATADDIAQFLKEGKNVPPEIETRIRETVSTPLEAVSYSVRVEATDNRFERFIDRQLELSQGYKTLRQSMSSQTPQSISDYQNNYPVNNLEKVSCDIDSCGSTVGVGTVLYHGGYCPVDSGKGFTSDRPFSTSFCPQIALRNAIWGGKAFDAGVIHLIIIRVAEEVTKAFATRLNGTRKGHEKEVVFSAGAYLYIRSKSLVTNSYKVGKVNSRMFLDNKTVPVYVFEAELR
ncbi:hypothetical protein SAMN04487881_0067 [Marinobacter sp. es.048]|uniref:hypothetical protein n=1 Tax=Marinobacter sp. es.048 TaxID=1761795 RepID=UPI000B7256F0|nr:hypothetical protein [Marinobacter sp. es.048]SNC59493.1 hypothetical protein SAMN04487881_0067 [Marinobacter sp. es.048]